jgi:outer membrane protein OmpA-like peptidoglycan-associated protein
MRKTVVAVLAVVMLAGIVVGDPALGGGRGLFRVYDARVEEDGALVWANRWMVSRTVYARDSTNYRGPLFGMEMSYAPAPFLEVFGNLEGVNEFVTNPFVMHYDWHGYGLGGKLSFPYLPVVKLAFAANWNIEHKGYTAPVFMDGLFNTGGYWRGIAAFRFWDLHKTLPTLMLNYGQTFNATPAKFAGTGLEFSSDVLDLFVEASDQGKPGASFTKYDQARLTPGVRLKWKYFHFNGGVELGLNDSTPKFEGIVGFSVVSPFPKPQPKPQGQFAGRVEDALTGRPLAAKIKFLNRKFDVVKTDPKNGTFYITRSPVGAMIVQASSDGYFADAEPIAIRDQGAATYTFRLRSEKPVGTIAGRVYDNDTKRPLVAKVSIVDTKLAPVMSSENTGFFRFDSLPIGLYNMMVECEGYINGEQVVEVEEAKVTKLEFGLTKPAKVETVVVKQIDTTGQTNLTRPAPNAEPGTIITLHGVLFDFDKSDIREDGRPALLEAAKILKQNPDVKVELRGYTDDRGSEEYNIGLSERRAQAVFDFLVREGVDANRMIVRGYGKTNFVASNDTDEGRQQNRRVDFVVVK